MAHFPRQSPVEQQKVVLSVLEPEPCFIFRQILEMHGRAGKDHTALVQQVKFTADLENRLHRFRLSAAEPTENCSMSGGSRGCSPCLKAGASVGPVLAHRREASRLPTSRRGAGATVHFFVYFRNSG
jgi:hypothetical protein